MKDLKQYIDKVLGNNIRCLLPSYWWKRLLGLIVDEVEGKASKESVATLKKQIENFKDGGVQAITIYPLDRSTKQSYHRQVYDTLVELDAKGEDFIVYADVETGIFPATMIAANLPLDIPYCILDFLGWDTKIHGHTETKKGHYTVALFADGTMQLDNTQDYVIDHVMSDTSTNAVQNKVIKAYVDAEVAKKVDKVEGKQLSTEDFTSALKTKLEGLSNYDDTELSEAIETLRSDFDTLVSGDTTTAIKTFNEIISFLDGIEDSESLDSIIASIEQQIANKQDKIEDLETIRSGAALGATALQEHQDISHLATKEEVTNLQNEVIANEEVSAAAFNEINERIEQLSEVSGAAATKEELAEAVTTLNGSIATKQDTLVSGTNIKTLNGESILGEGDIVLNVDTSSLATKEELESLTNEVITNEEVSAAALNELNDRVNEISENVSGTTVTKEEFESTVATINERIDAKADATSTSESIASLEESVSGINTSLTNYATTEALNGAVEIITNTIIENEEISAAALNDLQSKIEDIYSKLNALGA